MEVKELENNKEIKNIHLDNNYERESKNIENDYKNKEIPLEIKMEIENSVEKEGVGYSLCWKDISYKVQKKKFFWQKEEIKTVLKGVSGIAHPGTLVSIMGPSGSGKSSLLDILANRINNDKYEGELLVNGKSITKKYKRLAAYITQDDVLQNSLTVKENLLFSALMRIPQSEPYIKKKERVEEAIRLLGLTDVVDTTIGTPFVRGVSGGERKRTSVAMEIINKPNEPTSGLDSLSAVKTIQLLKDLAIKYNIAIIITIHQPSSYMYNLFDGLILLSKGNVVYSGPRENVIDFFKSVGHIPPIYVNPADFFMEIINFDFKEKNKEEQTNELINAFKKSEYHENLLKDIEKEKEFNNNNIFSDEQKIESYATGFFYQTWILLKRTTMVYLKNPLAYWTRIGMYTMMALLLGTTYWRINHSQNSIQDRVSALFFAIGFLSFMSIAAFPSFIEDRLLFVRERSNGVYRVGPFALATTIIQIPFVAIITILFTCISYYMVNFHNGSEHFFYFLLMLFISLYVADSIVVCVSAIVPWYLIGIAITAGMYGLWMLLSGFLIKKADIPIGWKWCFYLSFERYAFEGVMVNEFHGLQFPCGKTTTPMNTTICACLYPDINGDCIISGDEVLNEFGYSNVNKWYWLLVELLFAIGFRIIFYLLLRYLNKK